MKVNWLVNTNDTKFATNRVIKGQTFEIRGYDSEHFLILSEFSVSDLSLADTGWYKVSWPQMEVQWVLCPPATYISQTGLVQNE